MRGNGRTETAPALKEQQHHKGINHLDIFILVQILGIITLVMFVISMQQRKKESFLLLQTLGTIFFVTQYILTDKITGAVIFSIAAVRGIVFFYYKKKNLKPSRTVLIVFLAVLSVSTYFTWQSMLSIVPYISTVARTWGTWQDDMKWARRTSFLAQTCMIIYNVAAAMYTGALTEACNSVSSLIAIWRYDLRKVNKPSP